MYLKILTTLIRNQFPETDPQGNAIFRNYETLSLHIPVELKTRYIPQAGGSTPDVQELSLNVSILNWKMFF